MTTKCHKSGRYLIEELCGVVVFYMLGTKKRYRGECSACGKRHYLTWRELQSAMKANKDTP